MRRCSPCCSRCCSSTFSAQVCRSMAEPTRISPSLGLMLLNLTTAAMGTAVGLVSDITTGAIDRFSTLPMWRSAVLVGRSLADLLQAALCVVDRRFDRASRSAGVPMQRRGFDPRRFRHRAAVHVLAVLGLRLHSASCRKGAESAQGIGLIILIPAGDRVNAMVPTAGMPGWLQTIANWNPVSAVTAAVRTLFGSPNPSAQLQAWPMQHPMVASLAVVCRADSHLCAAVRAPVPEEDCGLTSRIENGGPSDHSGGPPFSWGRIFSCYSRWN